MKKFTLLAACAAVAMCANAQYQVDPGISQTLERMGDPGAYTVEAIVLDQNTISDLKAKGCTVNTGGMINNETSFWYWWSGWTAGDGSYPGVDFQMDGYISQVVAATEGWSGGGLNVQTGCGWKPEFNENTRFHMAYRASNPPTSLGVILLDKDGVNAPAKFAVGAEAFNDNGAVYPLVGSFDAGGDWAGIDVSFADLKKMWPAFNGTTTGVWAGNSISLLSGAVNGRDFSVDAIYFYTPNGAGVSDITTDDAPAVYYNLQGIEVANPQSGVYIRKQGDKATKVRL